MTLFYNDVPVNGYDKQGGLCFSEMVTGNEATMAEVLRRAYAIREVYLVKIEVCQSNTSIFDADGYEVLLERE